MSEESKPKMSGILEAIAVADLLLTTADRLTKWIQDRRTLGELTPEEEAALDAHLEAKFASPAWQKRPTGPTTPT